MVTARPRLSPWIPGLSCQAQLDLSRGSPDPEPCLAYPVHRESKRGGT